MSMNRINFDRIELPKGNTVACFAEQSQARDAVNLLSENGIDIKNVSIVGTDLKLVEHVTGKITLGRVLFAGMAQGLWLGLMMALIFVAVSEKPSWPTAAMAVTIGMGGGLLFGLFAYFLRPRAQNQVTTHSHVVAASYEVRCVEDSAKAREILAAMPGNQYRQVTQTPRIDDPSTRPPRYGVRLAEDEKAKILHRSQQEREEIRRARGLSKPEENAENGLHGDPDDTHESAPTADNPYRRIPSRRSTRQQKAAADAAQEESHAKEETSEDSKSE
ncbi:hypothetical protein KRX54_03570 [Actinomycetaceae bacterium TAE3-ERU4]|nr:hypothetical protein [Actinomycetaceae bacterium TAE3-ERU4]